MRDLPLPSAGLLPFQVGSLGGSVPVPAGVTKGLLLQGWDECSAMDMNQFFTCCTPEEEQQRLQALEPFDEYEVSPAPWSTAGLPLVGQGVCRLLQPQLCPRAAEPEEPVEGS